MQGQFSGLAQGTLRFRNLFFSEFPVRNELYGLELDVEEVKMSGYFLDVEAAGGEEELYGMKMRGEVVQHRGPMRMATTFEQPGGKTLFMSNSVLDAGF